MLKKLLKYEWKSVAGILALLHGALIVLTIVSRIFVPLVNIDYLSSIIPSTFTAIFFFSLFALSIGSFFFLVIRFYRNMYTDQGYLMHTLPVKPSQLIWSKAIIFVAWNAINFIVSIICLIVFISGLSDQSIFTIFADIPEILAEMGNVIAGNPALGIIALIISLIVFALHSIFMAYCAITIGHLFNKHKLLLSVVFYFVLYIGMQIITSTFMVIFLVRPLVEVTSSPLSQMADYNPNLGYFRMVFFGWVLMHAILTGIFYFVINRIINKNLNLE